MDANKIYQLWSNSPQLHKREKRELSLLSNQEIEAYFSDQFLLFGTAGVRGKMGLGTQRMNRFTYIQLAQAYAKYISATYPQNLQIVIGHDNRIDSKRFAKLCADVMTSFNIRVLLFSHNRLMPTPIVSYAIRRTNSSGGIIITASHNPKEYNGFKAYNPDGGQILPDVVESILAFMTPVHKILEITYHSHRRLIKYLQHSIVKQYFHDARTALINLSTINEKKAYPVVFTGHHGTACVLGPQFLKQLKFNIKPVRAQSFYSSTFVNSPNANPETLDSFTAAIAYAEKINSELCIGVDPDGDRMAIAIKKNNQWRLMTGNEMGILYTYYVLKHKQFTIPPYVVSSWVSTNLVDRIANLYHAKVYRTGTGFKWMGHQVSEIGDSGSLVVAFEEAIGALNTNINRDKDSFTASALALEIYDHYRKQKMDLIDVLIKEVYPQFGWWFGKTESYTFDVLAWKPLLQSKMTILKNYHNKSIGALKIKKIQWNKEGDCLEWLLEQDAWIKFRLSGTEPKLKIYYNLYDKSEASLLKTYNDLSIIFRKLLGV